MCLQEVLFLAPAVSILLAFPAGAQRARSVSPAAGSGFAQAMKFVFAEARGWQDLDVVDILINHAFDGRSACYLAYSGAGLANYRFQALP
jgi:hypothetical protein